jgi:hypothetical protein
MKMIWTGSLNHKAKGLMVGYKSGCNAMCMLAGKTPIMTTIKPQAPILVNLGIRTMAPNPPLKQAAQINKKQWKWKIGRHDIHIE